VIFLGFLRYLEADEEQDEGGEGAWLPEVEPGQALSLECLEIGAHVTQPRPRFTRATLIREMERVGIGRPATYVRAVQVLFEREYLTEAKKQVVPTGRGRVIDAALARAFPGLAEAAYTAQMEAELDRVGEGALRWQEVLRAWHGPFAAQLVQAGEAFAADAQRPEVQGQLPELPRATEKACPLCRKPLVQRLGKKGPFLTCTGYPGCTYTADPSAQPSATPCPSCRGRMEEVAGRYGRYARCLDRGCAGRVDLAPLAHEPCPVCQGPMRDRGAFFSCARYPACKGSLGKPQRPVEAKDEGKACPRCQSALARRQGPRGPFWGCTAYPRCRHTQRVTAERHRPRKRPQAS
jgi:DNA topoisomerase-1